MKSTSQKNGFTLIELLVVVAIIGVISSVVLASLGGAREGARDARRQQDMRSIQTAIELYKLDHAWQAPFSGTAQTGGSRRVLESNDENWSQLANQLKPYIDPLPVDPVNNEFQRYFYRTDNFGERGECNLANYESGEYGLVFPSANELDGYQLYGDFRDQPDQGALLYCASESSNN